MVKSSAMRLRFWKRPAPPPADPLAAYDDLLRDLEAEASGLRRAAATLMAVRADLLRDLERVRAEQSDLERRRTRAKATGDARTAELLATDAGRRERRRTETVEALTRTEVDVERLTHAAERVAGECADLAAERRTAAVRLEAGASLAKEALRAHGDRVRRLLAVDAARDEVERAHALAELVREDG